MKAGVVWFESLGVAKSYFHNKKWAADLLASIVVFLVALPLSMGIAIASGVPMEKAVPVGLTTAIVGGLVVGFIAGCPLQVSGPAAGLVVLVALEIEKHGFEMLGVIVLLAGVIQILAGLVRMGQWFRAVSPAVIQGMLAGIGVLIFAAQFHVMVDDKPPGTGHEFGGIINLATIPQAIWKGFTEPAHQGAALTGLFTIAAIVLWSVYSSKRLKLLPAPLVGVVLATGAVQVLGLEILHINVPERLTDALHWPTLENLSRVLEWPVLVSGLALAFVASAESLLTATAVDAMQTHALRTRYDRELVAQGVGNMMCGTLGALPMTGVIVRSAANVQAGAQTRVSAILHGLWILVFVALLPNVLEMIPVASLAAVLVYTGFKLMNPQAVRSLLPYGRTEVAIYAATLGTVVVVDLLTGIAVGILLTLAKLLYTFSHLVVRLEKDPRRGLTTLYLEGAATVISLPRLAAALETIDVAGAELHVHFEELTYIDHACLDLLMNWEKQHEASGGTLVIDWESLHAKFFQEENRRGGAQ